ncbi:MAG: GTPase Era [Peptococcaceae bacterium]|nr:GTPase Era [Peptococcaceae bacterium]
MGSDMVIQEGFLSGFVAVIGRPNAGKSTLLNALLGQKVLIMSDKPQTTRNTIRCIVTESRGQIIFLDTPGIHKPKDRLGEWMLEEALGALRAVDVVIWVADATATWGTGDASIAEVVQASGLKTLLVLNKVDLLNKSVLLPLIDEWSRRFDFAEIVPVSALREENTSRVLDSLWAYLPEGPMYYPEDEVTDRPERFIAAEIVREKVFALTREEIPYAVGVVVEGMEEKAALIKIEAVLFVERDSQKGIVIGKDGSLIKEVGRQAREELEELLNRKVLLKLWVKVRKDWRNRGDTLRELGYE